MEMVNKCWQQSNERVNTMIKWNNFSGFCVGCFAIFPEKFRPTLGQFNTYFFY